MGYVGLLVWIEVAAADLFELNVSQKAVEERFEERCHVTRILHGDTLHPLDLDFVSNPIDFSL